MQSFCRWIFKNSKRSLISKLGGTYYWLPPEKENTEALLYLFCLFSQHDCLQRALKSISLAQNPISRGFINDSYCHSAGIHSDVCAFVDEGVTKEEEQHQKIDITRLSASSVGSFKFYREFDGTTSAKLSRTSKLGHQGILVTPRVTKYLIVQRLLFLI